MDPQAKAYLAAAVAAGGPSVKDMPVEEARAMYASQTAVLLPARDDVESDDFLVYPESTYSVPCRMYRPAGTSDTLLPVVVYFHGGGWVIGSIETHDTLCQHLSHISGAAVVSVDYRLAPEHPFPAAAEDCYRVVDYVANRAGALFLDPTRIAVAGDSAGGNLAASATLAARAYGIDITFQALVYPVTDSACDTLSYREFATDHGLSKDDMQYFWKCYLEGGRRHAASASLLTEDLSELPPAFVLTAEYDVLRDEGEAYGARLRDAGVPVELEHWDGQLHGFFHHAGYFDAGKRAVERVGIRLREALFHKHGK
jgi:acetyl esterase